MHPSEPLIRKMTLADLNDLYALLSDSEVMNKQRNSSWTLDSLKILWSMLLRTAAPLLAM